MGSNLWSDGIIYLALDVSVVFMPLADSAGQEVHIQSSSQFYDRLHLNWSERASKQKRDLTLDYRWKSTLTSWSDVHTHIVKRLGCAKRKHAEHRSNTHTYLVK